MFKNKALYSEFFIVIFAAIPLIAQDSLNYNRLIWPQPQPHEVQVLILGTYHFSNPGLDAANVYADDVRHPGRQRELRALADRLVRFDPQVVAVEWDYRKAASVDSLYNNIPLDTLLKTKTNEVIQIGFRVAKRLNLPKVHPIDYPMRLGNDSLSALYERHGGSFPHTVEYPKINFKAVADADSRMLRQATILDFLRYKNSEKRHLNNHYGMFGMLRVGENNNFGGARLVTTWYERNLRMVHNIYRTLKPDTKRVLLIVGAGHISPLRHILDDAPMFCPLSALPYLE